MSNGINDLSPDIRDFLLNRNLIVSDSISDNGLSSVAVGLGSQANISSNENSIIASENLELSAIEYRKSVIGRNRYISTDDMVSATIIDNSFSYAQTNGGYIDENKELNIFTPEIPFIVIPKLIGTNPWVGEPYSGFLE